MLQHLDYDTKPTLENKIKDAQIRLWMSQKHAAILWF